MRRRLSYAEEAVLCFKEPMNETELLDSPSTGLRTGLHDAQILAIKQDGRRVIIEINHYHFITPGDGSLAIRAESVRLRVSIPDLTGFTSHFSTQMCPESGRI